MRQRLVQRLRQRSGEPGEDLALGAPGQIGAWPTRGEKELGNARGSLIGHRLSQDSLPADYDKALAARATAIAG
jgi:hypothetical protein